MRRTTRVTKRKISPPTSEESACEEFLRCAAELKRVIDALARLDLHAFRKNMHVISGRLRSLEKSPGSAACSMADIDAEASGASEANYRVIKNAIRGKHFVVAIYEGHWRWMCPYAVGWKDGRRLGLFYQFAGSNRNGSVETDSPDNWQYIPLDELSDVVTRPAPWFYGETHTRPAPCLDEVDAEVEA
jgi:hypothetical protein